MNELLGMLDSLEATLLEGRKIPLSDMVMISEKPILSIVDKMRTMLKNKETDFARTHVEIESDTQIVTRELSLAPEQESKLISQASVKAQEIKNGANDYADNVLSNLQLMVVKMQKNIITLEKNIESGRKILDAKDQESDN